MEEFIPLLAEEGAKREPDRAKPEQKCAERSEGADGVVSSAANVL